MKFRKKPVVVEAYQLKIDAHWMDTPDWLTEKMKEGSVGMSAFRRGLIIHTLEGDMQAEFGDWIIRGIKGELYPCKSDIFDLTYERVEE